MHKLTDSPRMVRKLIEYSEEIVDEVINPLPRDSSQAIVAGKTLDLSGDLDCCFICLDEQLDRLMERSWPYFDQVVVRGLAPEKVIEYARVSDDAATKLIVAHAQILFRVQEVGLSPLVIFRPKPVACSLHYETHAEEAGITDILPRSRAIIAELAKLGNLKHFEISDNYIHYVFTHPALPHYVENVFRPKRISRSPDASKILPLVAENVFYVCSAHLVSDVSCAKTLQTPLITEVRLHREMLAAAADHGHAWPRQSASKTEAQAYPTVEDVVFELELPIIRGERFSDVVALRESQYESFERFRDTLRQAIQARFNAGETDVCDIAREIERDIIAPGLNEIAQKVRTAQGSLGNKVSLSFGAGSFAITIGLLNHIPLLAGTGLAVAATAAQHWGKYFDDRREVQLHDLYFLWRATG